MYHGAPQRRGGEQFVAEDAVPRPAERQVPGAVVSSTSVSAGELVRWRPRLYPPVVQQHGDDRFARNSKQELMATREARHGALRAVSDRGGEGGVERQVSEEAVLPFAGSWPGWRPRSGESVWLSGESAREAERAAPRPLSQAQVQALSQRHTQMLGPVGLVPVQRDGGAQAAGGSEEREGGLGRQVSEEIVLPAEFPREESLSFAVESDRAEGGDGDGESTESEEDS